MSKTTQRLAEVAEALSPEAQAALLAIAENLARPESFDATMTPAQRAELQRSMSEAARGEVVTDTELDQHLDALLARTA